jgi:AbrB family looped-hinge helix DNA binding protein
MAKVTSKLQITLPKRIADAHGIRPGDEIHFTCTGDSIRITPAALRSEKRLDVAERLRLFDDATRRAGERAAALTVEGHAQAQKDWRRDDLYTRGSSD